MKTMAIPGSHLNHKNPLNHPGTDTVDKRSSLMSYMSVVSSGSSSESDHHTVVPLAVARRRMSEIVSYKAKECSAQVSSPVWPPSRGI